MSLFKITNYPVGALISQIDLGKIGLPELQRPFVWPNVNVRNLFDSLYRGYPAGFLLFWETGAEIALKPIGAKNEESVPSVAIVDGQQRLTALYAVFKGAEVWREDFKKEKIRIAFNPLTERFDVTDAAIIKDRAFIPDISQLWNSSTRLLSFTRSFITELSSIRSLSEEERFRIEDAIGTLYNIPSYQFVVLTLEPTVDAEMIAEIFVRINGEGKKLNQSDFIMTLMSVFWDDGRAELESFSRLATIPAVGHASPFNPFIKPAPDQMLRATVGLALRRARLESVYSALRGRDAKTGLDNPEKRDEQFALMREGQKYALNLSNWHHFLTSLIHAGYRSGRMISSENAIIFCYVLYLIGVRDFGITKKVMRQAIAEFFFMAALTGRYTNSPETRFESDLSLIRTLQDGAALLAKLRELCTTALTGDYWTITLPNQLATSASRGPALFAYQAALVKLEALALFSPIKIADLLTPSVQGAKAPLERHHLFPRAYLERIGISDGKKINEIANLAPVEWPDNIAIGDKAPSEYVPPLDAALTAPQRQQLYFWHALPHLWWELPYEEFLIHRRERMAAVIREAWNQLIGDSQEKPVSVVTVADLIAGGESGAVEFKSTLRANLHTNQPDDKIQFAVLKTIAAFLNAKGGMLLVGISDGGEVLGLDADGFINEDKMGLHLVNLVKDRIGDIFMPYVHLHFEDHDDKRVLSVRCDQGPKAAFLKDGNAQRFFVRGGNATSELVGTAMTDYIKQRFV